MQNVFTTFSIQFIIEGVGEISLAKLKEAVHKACEACPGARASIIGRYWVDSERDPPIICLDSLDFDGFSFDRVDLFKTKIDSYQSPCTEIYYIKSPTPRMIFRVFHGAMDGKGALTWVSNIFKALRDEATFEAKSTLTDLQFLETIKNKASREKINLNLDKTIFKKKSSQKTREVYWKRLTLPGRYAGVLAKIGKTLTEYYKEDENKFLVPVDIRRHGKASDAIANLTLPIFLETKKTESWEDINGKLLYGLKKGDELNFSNAEENFLTKLPDFVMKKSLSLLGAYQKIIKKFMVGGILSHLGKIKLADFSTDTFKANKFYSLPIQQPLTPLSLVAVETDDETEVVISSYTDLLEKDDCEKILSLIEESLTGTNVYQVINDTKKEFQFEITPYEMIEASLLGRGKAIAFYENEKVITYEELNYRVNYLVSWLEKQGITKNGRVILCLGRSSKMLSLVLAIMKVGAVFIPIDSHYPAKKIFEFLESDNIDFLFYESANEDNYGNVDDKKTFNIDRFDFLNMNNSFSSENTIRKSKHFSDDVVYQIYTSGTTGRPKGVQVTNLSFANYLNWARDIYRADEKTCFPFFTSISVDLTLTSIFLPLVTGGSIFIYNENTTSHLLKKILNNERLNFIKLTPTHLKLICQNGEAGKNKKVLIVGGEQLEGDIALKAQQLFGQDCLIVNEYGPTEATVGCVYHSYDLKKETSNEAVPIGIPIANTKIYICDENLKLVPVGRIGELYVGGKCLAKGYYSNGKFSEMNLVTIHGEKFYKTGDLVKFNSNLKLIYLGRNDDQVKILGHRVELGEIRSALLGLTEINDVFITHRKNDENQTELLAYYLSSKPLLKENILAFLQKKLPLHMIPKKYKRLESFPIAKGGKIDKTLLPEINEQDISEISKITDSVKSEKPRDCELTELELNIFRIWSKILKTHLSKQHYNVSFYDLGGDSLNLIKMLNEVVESLLGTDNEEFLMSSIQKFYNEITIRNLVFAIHEIIDSKKNKI